VIFRGLRTKIVINIAMLMFLGMVLIDLVMMATVKRELIQSEMSKADILLTHIENILLSVASEGRPAQQLRNEPFMMQMVDDAQFECALIMGDIGEQMYPAGQTVVSYEKLARLTQAAIASGKKTNHLFGSLWSVVFKQKTGFVLSAPLINDGTTLGGISIVLSLDRIYQTLKDSQQILFIYIFINLAILTYICHYRISRLYLQPLARLAKRAEDYKEDDEIIFSVRKADNELNRLSKALNIMLKRISDDKKRLRSTVLSLEKANLDLKKAQMEIIRAEKLASVGRLSAGIAHEIGNPIGIVIGYLELLKHKDITASERNEYIRRTEEEVERINRIIRQLLAVARPSNSGRVALSVHDLIRDMADVLSVQPLMSNIELSLDLAAESDTVLADPDQLRQVFLNLIINAADAISDIKEEISGELKITTELKKDTVSKAATTPYQLRILFSDNGPGISEEDLQNIFDPFFTTKDPGKGTGLGLSVSFMIVESLHGKMTGISDVGKGTTLIISLPLYKVG
jgi:signal transduction histidine kinase